MTKHLLFFFSVILVLSGAVSCVPGKKFKTLEDTSKQYLNERDALKTENIDLSMTNKELEAKIASLEKESSAVKEELQNNCCGEG